MSLNSGCLPTFHLEDVGFIASEERLQFDVIIHRVLFRRKQNLDKTRGGFKSADCGRLLDPDYKNRVILY